MTPFDFSFVRPLLLSIGNTFYLIGGHGSLVPVATVRVVAADNWALRPVENGGKPKH